MSEYLSEQRLRKLAGLPPKILLIENQNYKIIHSTYHKLHEFWNYIINNFFKYSNSNIDSFVADLVKLRVKQLNHIKNKINGVLPEEDNELNSNSIFKQIKRKKDWSHWDDFLLEKNIRIADLKRHGLEISFTNGNDEVIYSYNNFPFLIFYQSNRLMIGVEKPEGSLYSRRIAHIIETAIRMGGPFDIRGRPSQENITESTIQEIYNNLQEFWYLLSHTIEKYKTRYPELGIYFADIYKLREKHFRKIKNNFDYEEDDELKNRYKLLKSSDFKMVINGRKWSNWKTFDTDINIEDLKRHGLKLSSIHGKENVFSYNGRQFIIRHGENKNDNLYIDVEKLNNNDNYNISKLLMAIYKGRKPDESGIYNFDKYYDFEEEKEEDDNNKEIPLNNKFKKVEKRKNDLKYWRKFKLKNVWEYDINQNGMNISFENNNEEIIYSYKETEFAFFYNRWGSIMIAVDDSKQSVHANIIAKIIEKIIKTEGKENTDDDPLKRLEKRFSSNNRRQPEDLFNNIDQHFDLYNKKYNFSNKIRTGNWKWY